MDTHNLYDLAYRAFSGTSFSPERRAIDTVKWIEEELAADLIRIGTTGNYSEKYLTHARKWLSAKSQIMSTMITGPANFPVARNQKNMGYEESAWKNWMDWREKYIKAVFRVPTPSPEEDLDKALADYEKAVQNQERMKLANVILRKKGVRNSDKIEQLESIGYDDYLFIPECMGNIGFASYTLTNNNAKIKRLKTKVMVMRNRIEAKADWEPIEFEGGRIDIQADRVCIFHDDKPDAGVRSTLKSKGFRWSSQYICWSRKHTANAVYDAKEIVRI